MVSWLSSALAANPNPAIAGGVHLLPHARRWSLSPKRQSCYSHSHSGTLPHAYSCPVSLSLALRFLFGIIGVSSSGFVRHSLHFMMQDRAWTGLHDHDSGDFQASRVDWNIFSKNFNLQGRDLTSFQCGVYSAAVACVAIFARENSERPLEMGGRLREDIEFAEGLFEADC